MLLSWISHQRILQNTLIFRFQQPKPRVIFLRHEFSLIESWEPPIAQLGHYNSASKRVSLQDSWNKRVGEKYVFIEACSSRGAHYNTDFDGWFSKLWTEIGYLLKEVSLAASWQLSCHFLSYIFWQQVSWILIVNFCSYGLLDSFVVVKQESKNLNENFFHKRGISSNKNFNFYFLAPSLKLQGI